MTFKSAYRDARLRALLLAALLLPVVSCNSSDLLDSTTNQPAADGESISDVGSETPPMAVSYAGGIPFGMFRLPTAEFNGRFNGAMRNIDAKHLVGELRAIKARGGKVALMFAGPEWTYQDGGHHFSFSKWKARVDRFKGVNFDSYVRDGTIIGHYLIDEPNDPRNWGGRPVPPSTLEEMARYSKSRWPGMVTIVRTFPDYLDDYRGSYRYLDAAWAQYVIHRWPDVNQFISTNVRKAQAKGLALIVGLNVIHGGSRRRTPMTATQVRKYGAALLNSNYPCAFISWQYRDSYMRAAVRDAMSDLRRKAQARGFKSCRGS
jgi:hypothetical protein